MNVFSSSRVGGLCSSFRVDFGINIFHFRVTWRRVKRCESVRDVPVRKPSK